jgi:hypothetical protein
MQMVACVMRCVRAAGEPGPDQAAGLRHRHLRRLPLLHRRLHLSPQQGQEVGPPARRPAACPPAAARPPASRAKLPTPTQAAHSFAWKRVRRSALFCVPAVGKQ